MKSVLREFGNMESSVGGARVRESYSRSRRSQSQRWKHCYENQKLHDGELSITDLMTAIRRSYN